MRVEGVDRGGLGVQTVARLLGERGNELGELLGGVDRPVIHLPGGLDHQLGLDDLFQKPVKAALDAERPQGLGVVAVRLQ